MDSLELCDLKAITWELTKIQTSEFNKKEKLQKRELFYLKVSRGDELFNKLKKLTLELASENVQAWGLNVKKKEGKEKQKDMG